jgi:hypothetical protein
MLRLIWLSRHWGVILDPILSRCGLFLDHSTESRGLQLTVSIGAVIKDRRPMMMSQGLAARDLLGKNGFLV